MNIRNPRYLNLLHLMNEILYRPENIQHERHFIDSWFCHYHGFVTSGDRPCWSKARQALPWSKQAIEHVEKGQVEENNLRKEHRKPLKVIKSELATLNLIEGETVANIETIEAYLLDHFSVAYITVEEDNLLRDSGLNFSMPSDGKCRYQAVGIELVNNPYQQRTKDKYWSDIL